MASLRLTTFPKNPLVYPPIAAIRAAIGAGAVFRFGHHLFSPEDWSRKADNLIGSTNDLLVSLRGWGTGEGAKQRVLAALFQSLLT